MFIMSSVPFIKSCTFISNPSRPLPQLPLICKSLTPYLTHSFYIHQSFDLILFPCSDFTPTPSPTLTLIPLLTLTCTTHSTLRLTMEAQHGVWMDAQESQQTWPSSPYGSPTASKPKHLKPPLKGTKSLCLLFCVCVSVCCQPWHCSTVMAMAWHAFDGKAAF